jgi:hypothetical protein
LSRAGLFLADCFFVFSVAIHCCPKQIKTREERAEGSRSYEVKNGLAGTTPQDAVSNGE